MAGRSYSLIQRPHVKPAPGTPLNRHHPAVRALKFLWPFWEGNPNAAGKGPLPRELLTGAISSVDLGNGYQWAADQHGLGLHYTGGQPGDELGLGLDTALFPTAPDFTVVYVHRKLDTTLRAHGNWGDSSGTIGTFCGMLWPYSDGQGYFDFGGATSNTSRLIIPASAMPNTNQYEVLVGRVNPFSMAVFRNGAKIGQTTGTPVTRSNAGVNVRIGRHDGQGGNDESVVYLLAFFHVGLPDDLCIALSINPWAMFESVEHFRTVFIPATAGDGSAPGAATVSGISAPTIGAVASSAGSATVSGAGENAAAFHEANGAAAGAATVSGVSAAIVARNGVAAGVATASGVSIFSGVLLPVQWTVLRPADVILALSWKVLPEPVVGAALGLRWRVMADHSALGLRWRVIDPKNLELFASKGEGAAAGIGEDVLLPVGRATKE